MGHRGAYPNPLGRFGGCVVVGGYGGERCCDRMLASRRAAVGLCGRCPAPLRVAAMRLRSLTPSAVGGAPACALRLPVSRGHVGWGWLAVPFILSHRSRRQGLRALWALAAMRPSSNL